MYETKRDYIEDNMDEFLKSPTNSQTKALERWLNIDDKHNKRQD